MSNKIVVRAKASLRFFLVYLWFAFIAVLFLEFSTLLFLIAEFLFLLSFIFFLFYNKIELSDNILTVWIFFPVFFKISCVAIDLNNITELEFIQLSHNYRGRTSTISGKENVVTIYYLLSNGVKSKITISEFLFPSFKSISDKILADKSEIKITFKNKKQSNY